MVPKPKAYLSKKYQKFMALVLKHLSCIDQKHEKWKPNEKFSIKNKHFGGVVIYVHFYKWDRLLDFMLVVYNLIELIIEASY